MHGSAEWKIELDDPNEQHRHLSNLYGFYPGYAISSVYRKNDTIMNAVETTLIHRGLGKGPDADAGYVTFLYTDVDRI